MHLLTDSPFENEWNLDLSKRFYLFMYENFYPQGGLNDIKFTGDTVQECQDALDRELKSFHSGMYCIFDVQERCVVVQMGLTKMDGIL